MSNALSWFVAPVSQRMPDVAFNFCMPMSILGVACMPVNILPLAKCSCCEGKLSLVECNTRSLVLQVCDENEKDTEGTVCACIHSAVSEPSDQACLVKLPNHLSPTSAKQLQDLAENASTIWYASCLDGKEHTTMKLNCSCAKNRFFGVFGSVSGSLNSYTQKGFMKMFIVE